MRVWTVVHRGIRGGGPNNWYNSDGIIPYENIIVVVAKTSNEAATIASKTFKVPPGWVSRPDRFKVFPYKGTGKWTSI